jgi:hypothetical protein
VEEVICRRIVFLLAAVGVLAGVPLLRSQRVNPGRRLVNRLRICCIEAPQIYVSWKGVPEATAHRRIPCYVQAGTDTNLRCS